MRYNFKELIDIPRLQDLTDALYAATSIPSAIITIDGEILTGSGWQKICTDFHRKHPELQKECIKSDLTLRKKLDEGEPFVIYTCPRGLTDASSPVIIEGTHVANVFSGQVFLSPPDPCVELFFREQAILFGFDEDVYIKAFKEIPVFTKEKFQAGILFLAKLSKIIADMGRVRLNELKSMAAVKESEEKYRSLFENMVQGVFYQRADGVLVDYNKAALEMFGLTCDQFLGKSSIDPQWKVIKEDGTDLPGDKHPSMTALKTGKPVQDEIVGVYNPVRKDYTWLVINAIPQFKPGEEKPYQVFVTLHDITERKRTELLVKEKNNLIEGIVNSIKEGIIIYDRELKYQVWNPFMERLSGVPASDVLGHHPMEVFPFLKEAGVVDRLKGALTGDSYGEMEFSFSIPGTGQKGWVSDACGPLLNVKNEIVGVIATVRDITDRKTAEQVLRHDHHLIERIMETSPSGIACTDRKGIITYANRRAEEILGIRLTTSNIRSYNDPSWKIVDFRGNPFPQEALPFSRVKNTGRPVFGIQHAIEWLDGKRILLSINASALLDSDGEFDGIVSSIEDITEKFSSEQKYQMLFNEMIDGFALHEILCDANGHPIDYRFLDVNPAFERLTTLKKESLVGKTVLEVMPKTESYWIEKYGQVALTGEPVFFENYSQELGRYYQVTAFSPYRNQFACIFVDITAHKKMEEQLLHSQKMESIGRLAGGVAHDFNNMLSIILGNAELIMEDLDTEHPVVKNLHEIHKAAERSANLTRQLLAFARKQTISPKVLDLNKTIEGMLKMLRRLIGENINLAWLPKINLWAVKVDPSQVDQILANLCVNAKDAIKDVGKVTIETGNVSFDKDYCREHEGFMPGDYVMTAVSDNGCGMDKKIQENLFEPFFTTKGVGQGTGLGLATVYGIVKQNNGFINVYSEPGKGTTFRIYLPRYAEEVQPEQNPESKEADATGCETILLVEDEAAILKMTTMMLERMGYAVLAVSDPTEAIAMGKAHNGKISLLMTDVVMPGMNGRDLAGKMTQLFPTLKCLFMSGHTANVIAHHGVLDHGMQFLQKPFSRQELAVKIREMLDDQGL